MRICPRGRRIDNLQDINSLHASLCQAIADSTRISILYALGEGPCHVNELVKRLSLPQTTISRHLKVLREQSLVSTRREGSYIYYELVYKRILKALEIMRSVKLDIVTREHDVMQGHE